MTSFQADSEVTSQSLANNEVNQLIDEATSINHVEIIQTVIASLDQNESAMVSQTQAGYLWKFNYGSVEVFVQLTGSTEEDTLTVWSSILPLPAKNESQLMRKLLEMNWLTTFEARFAIFDTQIVVLSTRTLAGLSAGEISRLITVVAAIADDNDEALQSEFKQ